MKPNSLFVANFIGESNLLEGLITDAKKGNLEIELRGGAKVHTFGAGSEGDRVIVVVRPEVLVVEREEKKGENLLKGVVSKITFEGTFMRYVIRLESEDSVVVTRPSLTEKWFEVRESITLSFEPEMAHVFPYPPSGLAEEISV
jgi:ABC-type Fe3+/spermidine/putrescine transport system ATPase subunit